VPIIGHAQDKQSIGKQGRSGIRALGYRAAFFHSILFDSMNFWAHARSWSTVRLPSRRYSAARTTLAGVMRAADSGNALVGAGKTLQRSGATGLREIGTWNTF
jgi:hypothetical protein